VKLWVDDIREAPDGWIRTRSAWAAIEILSSGGVMELSLDHDLGPEKEVGTGYTILNWIEERVVLNNFVSPVIRIHTSNISARIKMEQARDSIMRLTKNPGGR